MLVNDSVTNLGAVAMHALPDYFSLISFKLPAGFPSPATDYLEDGLDLNAFLVQHKEASFIFQVKGHSMQHAGILDGDKVIVDKSLQARHGDIVVAVVDGDFTIKRLFKRGQRIELHPDNPAFQPMVFVDGQELKIWGVVVGSIRRYV